MTITETTAFTGETKAAGLPASASFAAATEPSPPRSE
jgi:hypothetical protein